MTDTARLLPSLEAQPVFRVWDRQRECWAGFEGDGPNVRDLEDYALDEFKDAKLVYCDMEGWALADDGGLLLLDECGNFAYADPERYEVRFNPDYLAACDLASTQRWRTRAESAERELVALRGERDRHLAQAVESSLEVDALASALGQYGQHKPGCVAHMQISGGLVDQLVIPKCTCGLADALAALTGTTGSPQ